MFVKLTEDEYTSIYTNGTSLSDYLTGVAYYKIVQAFGEPTFNTPSDDGKVQKEWVFKDAKENGFTIYDWKTYNEAYTVNDLRVWNVGSKTSPIDFIQWVEERLRGVVNV